MSTISISPVSISAGARFKFGGQAYEITSLDVLKNLVLDKWETWVSLTANGNKIMSMPLDQLPFSDVEWLVAVAPKPEEPNDDSKFIVIVGNVIDGVVVHGPFRDTDEAGEYAELELSDEWVIASLIAPVEPREGVSSADHDKA